MRPTTLLALASLSFAVVSACGKRVVEPRARPGAAPAPVDVVIGNPVPSPVVELVLAPLPIAEEPDPDEDRLALQQVWTEIVPGPGYADAIRRARNARTALVPPPAGLGSRQGEAEAKAWFARAHALVTEASRMYAAAFQAADASNEGRIEAIAEAAELDMAMARSLDDAGLGTMPPQWRADPSLASTFEDVALGPTRRWRDEARALARRCVDTARVTGVTTDSARRCAALRTGARASTTVIGRGADAGTGCACAQGDPLCSSSLDGWCGSTRP